MPAPGREALSSRLTSPLQLVPMLLWVADVYGLIWLVLHRMHNIGGLSPALERTVLVLLGLPFVLLPAVSMWAAGLRKVATDGVNLLVTTSFGGEALVPLTAVLDVAETRTVDLHIVKVTFEAKTRVGKIVRFLAPTRFTVPRDQVHPVVLALRDTVQAAHSSAKDLGFGRRSVLQPDPGAQA